MIHGPSPSSLGQGGNQKEDFSSSSATPHHHKPSLLRLAGALLRIYFFKKIQKRVRQSS
jgi:hypothetical protein